MKILQTDPRAGYLAHQSETDQAIARVLASGWFILGQETAAFESEFASWLGARQAVGVASGTDALVIALRACGVGPGDAVVTVSHTAVATVAAIELCGALPVLADIAPDTYTLSPESLETTIQGYLARSSNPRASLKAVVAVHLYGHPADLPAIQSVASRYDLTLIEDCAQSHGAKLQGRMTGTWGRAAAFSFYPTKNLAALGDGGAVVTNDSQVGEKARLLREYGWRQRYVSELPGMNSRLDELQSAILRVRLKHLTAENERRRSLARQYRAELQDTSLMLPTERPEAQHVYHQFVVRTPARDPLREHLREQGIGTLVHYPVPVHLQPAYTGRVSVSPDGLPHTEAAAKQVLSLPMYPQLTGEQTHWVTDRVAAWAHRDPQLAPRGVRS